MIIDSYPYFVTTATALLLLSFATACETTNSQNSEPNTAGFSHGGATATDGNVGGGTSGGPGGAENAGASAGHSETSVVENSSAHGLPVNLRTAANYVVLANSGISTVPTSVITGNLGLSPASATFFTGFSLRADPTNTFSISPQVTGKLYAADNTSPTPMTLTTAVGDMLLAFTDASSRTPTVSELAAGDVGGMTLTPGVYKWNTGLSIPTDLTLNGSATAVWIFQIAQNLTVGSGAKIVLADGALSQNVFWQVDGRVKLGTTAHFEGIVLTLTSVTLDTGASINGRLLAQTAVNLDSNVVVERSQ